MLVCYMLYNISSTTYKLMCICVVIYACIYIYIYIYKYMFCFDGVSQGDLVAMRFDLMTNIHNSL